MTPSPTLRQLAGVALLFLVASLGLVYGQTGTFSFVGYDDPFHIYNNRLLNPATPANIEQFWNVPWRAPTAIRPGQQMPPYEQLYAPLTFTVWAALTTIGRFTYPVPTPTGSLSQLNPAVFHAANVLVHLLNTLVVLALLWLLFNPRGLSLRPRWCLLAATMGAAVFGLHPYQGESVAWCTQLNTLLSTLLGLLALLTYFFCVKAWQDSSKRLAGLRYLGATLVFVLALLAKPSIVVLPLLAFLFVNFALRPGKKRQLLALTPWFLLCGLWTALVEARQPPPDPSIAVAWWQKFFLVGDSLAFYLGHLIEAWRLCPDYNRPPSLILATPLTYGVWLVPVLLLVGAFFARKKIPGLLLGLLLFFICVLPTAGLVPTYYQARSVVADRYMYVAMLGVAVLVAAAINSAARLSRSTRPALFGAVAMVLIGLVPLSYRQVSWWQDNATLYSFSGGMSNNHRSWWAFTSQAAMAMQAHNYTTAAILYEQALALKPDMPDVRYHLMVAQRLAGQG